VHSIAAITASPCPIVGASGAFAENDPDLIRLFTDSIVHESFGKQYKRFLMFELVPRHKDIEDRVRADLIATPQMNSYFLRHPDDADCESTESWKVSRTAFMFMSLAHPLPAYATALAVELEATNTITFNEIQRRAVQFCFDNPEYVQPFVALYRNVHPTSGFDLLERLAEAAAHQVGAQLREIPESEWLTRIGLTANR